MSVIRLLFLLLISPTLISCGTSASKYIDKSIEQNLDYVKANDATCGFFTDSSSMSSGYRWGYKYGVSSGYSDDVTPWSDFFVNDELKWYYTTCWWGNSGLEDALEDCSQSAGGDKCYLLFYRYPYNNEKIYVVWKEALSAWSEKQKQQQQVQQQKAQQRKTDDRASKCVSFGFQPNTSQYNDCMFELYKLEESARQNQALIQSLSDSSARQNAILQQQLEEQQFESGMRMLQNAADMVNPPSTRTTCRYNDLMKKVTCN